MSDDFFVPDVIPPMFFIARTDVAHDAGEQRVFGVAPDWQTANRYRAETASHRVGTFKIFEGVLRDTDPGVKG